MISRRCLPLLTVIWAVSACEAPGPAAPALEVPSLTARSGPSLLICPTNETSSTSELIPLGGGAVALEGHSVLLPFGSLLAPAEIGIEEPASQYVEIALTADGQPHYQFELPVVVTISYARCSRSNLFGRRLDAWYIDSATKELLEPMGGIDNPLLRTVTFFTNHFSGYAIAEGPR